MKRMTIIMILLLAMAVSAVAQQFENESEYYPKTLPIERISIHSLGYRIDYIKQDYTIGTFWAPVGWFRSAGTMGEIAYIDSGYPYVSFFYKNGVLDHFRLYLIESMEHSSWDILDNATDYSDRFPDLDSIAEIQF